ncbi:hypothetical protein LUZ61_009151 [Rhynchospora tenuis]|uniref:F-box domain-containing protein n=1 Tax=Rhynchospora tenuis TaxID=198213 RepID=A0AAD6EY12_9POAL|nr:hypothetical protein LUZ61_009151 [Rhynchospora tenuis]
MPELDRISDLSRDIVENILLRLPVREAVKTCCLSNNWRLAWSSISDLVYDKNSISISDTCSHDENLVETTKKMVEFVNKFLSIHDGSIRKFVIADVKPCPEALNGWVEVLMRKEIKEFLVTSQPFYPNNWKVPSTFWNLQCLRDVELSNCIIELPEAFKGFKVLKSLKLERHVCLRTPSVVKAVVCLNTKILPPCKTNLIDLLDCLPNIEALELGGRSTRKEAYYTYCHKPDKWDQYTVFEHLKFVKIVDSFKNHQSVLLFVAFLLSNTPILEELCFECEVEDPEFLEKLVVLKRASKNAKISRGVKTGFGAG